MLKILLIALLPSLVFFGIERDSPTSRDATSGRDGNTGTLEKMIVADGAVSMVLDLGRLGGSRSGLRNSKHTPLYFDAERNSFFPVLVFNGEVRGPLPGSMLLIPRGDMALPSKLSSSYRQLVMENNSWGEPYDLVIRDGKSGYVFFNIEGQEFDYDADQHVLNVKGGRLLLSKQFSLDLGRPQDAGMVVGEVSLSATMRPTEVVQYVDGEVKSEEMPSLNADNAGSVPGPDVIVGDLSGLAQFGGSSGTQVGLAVGTDSCNFGVENLHWFALPDNDHPVIPQNLYRMSGGPTNNDRFEQIGQSSVKHAFTALTNNICSLGCNGVGGSNLGSGCSDPYSASLNAGSSNALGSRAWINPFTGFYPRGDSATPPNNHSGHTHTGPSHRILTEMADLNTSLNSGATYYAEGQYITAHEYAWCQTHPGQCNQYNNVSYRQYSVIGTTSPFSFSPVGSTQRTKPAITAWAGATAVQIQPDPGNDGIGFVAYKVTNPSPGVWHYEYAIYNQNIDRAIQSFTVPTGNGATVTNPGFHAPPQHPGWTFDGTVGNAGFSSAPWAWNAGPTSVTWNSETFAQNQNANAIRWGTLYNFRFDANQPPQMVNATLGFLKTGNPITVQLQGPGPATVVNASISGRLVTSGGQAIGGVRVALDDNSGNLIAITTTSSFGFYHFDNVIPGRVYTIEPLTKRYAFTARTMTVNGDLTNVNFIDESNP